VKAVAVVGNPRTPSRTGVAALFALTRLGGSAADVIDLAQEDLQEGLAAARPGAALQAALARVQEAEVTVFASPTYKAAYTGLLKCFLDLLPHDALRGRLAVPLMLGAAEGHRLTVEHTLKPVLGELGAVCPARGVYVVDSGIQVDPPLLAPQLEADITAVLASLPRPAASGG
jgi:FMN reductase